MAPTPVKTAEWRTERARKAAKARHSLDTYVRTVVARAPELTPEQVESLRAVFAPQGEVA